MKRSAKLREEIGSLFDRAQAIIAVAEEDGVIPGIHSDALIEAFPPAQLSVTRIAGADHNTVHLLPPYEESLKAFLSGPRDSGLQEVGSF